MVGDNLNTITHSNRVGATDTLQAKVALHLTIKKLVIVCEDGVPAACVLNDESLHLDRHDLLVLGLDKGVELLDPLVVQLLQLVLGILLVVL